MSLWEPWEIKYLKDNYENTPDDIIMETIKRSKEGIRLKAFKFGLHKNKKIICDINRSTAKKRSNSWTKEEEQFLIDHSKIWSDKEIAHELNKTIRAIRAKRYEDKKRMIL